jgi:quercetin dioxygenase-like cupin family protein
MTTKGTENMLRLVTIDQPLGEVSDWDIFRGEVRYQPLVRPEDAEILRSAHITFRPEARTVWHHHECDQYLIITNGHGIVATEEQRLEVRQGDIVIVPKGIKHWHGAAPGSHMSHISVLTPGDEILHEDVEGE